VVLPWVFAPTQQSIATESSALGVAYLNGYPKLMEWYLRPPTVSNRIVPARPGLLVKDVSMRVRSDVVVS
jgi:hypothetical protein